MKIKNFIGYFIVACVFSLGGYFFAINTNDGLFVNNKLWNGGSGLIGFYRLFDYKENYKKDMATNTESREGIQGLAYCEFIAEGEKQLPTALGGGYVKLGDKILYKGEKITTCKNQCIVNEELPFILYDGASTYYNGELLSGFDYNNFIRLDDSDMIFTDKQNVYYGGRIFSGMDYMTYKKINQFTFQDKNYTYKIEQSPFDDKYNNKIIRTENK